MSDQGPSIHRRRRRKEWVHRESAPPLLAAQCGRNPSTAGVSDGADAGFEPATLTLAR